MITINENINYNDIMNKLKPYNKLFTVDFEGASSWDAYTKYIIFGKGNSEYRFRFYGGSRVKFHMEVTFQISSHRRNEIESMVINMTKWFSPFRVNYRIDRGGFYDTFTILDASIPTDRDLQVVVDGIKKTISLLDKVKRSGGVKRL